MRTTFSVELCAEECMHSQPTVINDIHVYEDAPVCRLWKDFDEDPVYQPNLFVLLSYRTITSVRIQEIHPNTEFLSC